MERGSQSRCQGMDSRETDKESHEMEEFSRIDSIYRRSFRKHLGGDDTLVSTKKGMRLKLTEYKRLKELPPEIGRNLSELDSVVPCAG